MVFYKVVFTITAVLAILVLAGMGVIMLVSKARTDWPPDVAECPDYWKVTGPDQCAADPAIGNAGSTGNNNFNALTSCNPGGTGNPAGPCGTYQQLLQQNGKAGALGAGSPRCLRKKWATENGIYWDGISNIDPHYC
jgi:hypothetical protein